MIRHNINCYLHPVDKKFIRNISDVASLRGASSIRTMSAAETAWVRGGVWGSASALYSTVPLIGLAVVSFALGVGAYGALVYAADSHGKWLPLWLGAFFVSAAACICGTPCCFGGFCPPNTATGAASSASYSRVA